jgi:hypothetical protein
VGSTPPGVGCALRGVVSPMPDVNVISIAIEPEVVRVASCLDTVVAGAVLWLEEKDALFGSTVDIPSSVEVVGLESTVVDLSNSELVERVVGESINVPGISV